MGDRKAIPTAVKKRVLERDNYKCRKCHWARGLELNHIKLHMNGGEDSVDNLITLCSSCHREWHMFDEQTIFTFEEWLELPNSIDLVLIVYQLFKAVEAWPEMNDTALGTFVRVLKTLQYHADGELGDPD